jgi:hypothetical protein
LGFQSANPWSDVRAGQFAPAQLHYLASKYPERLQLLVREAKGLGYPFACSCFNVSQVIALFFGLYDSKAMHPVSGAKPANRAQLSNFVRLCRVASPGNERHVLDELFCALVQQLHETWQTMSSTGKYNLMDFPVALREVHDRNALFWKTAHNQVADFERLVRGECDERVEGADVTSMLHGIFVNTVKQLWCALDTPLLNVITGDAVLSTSFGDSGSARQNAKQHGSYEPPAFTPHEGASSTTTVGATMPRPASDPDLDSFLRDLDMCCADVASISSPTCPAPHEFLAPEPETTERTECTQVGAHAAKTVNDGLVQPKAQTCNAPPVGSFHAFEPEAFFREWGIGVDVEKQQMNQNHGLRKDHDLVELDAFLNDCLAK